MTGKDLVFPDFDDIEVSTKTFTATTNLKINLERLYHNLPITPYIVIEKKRGRKPKVEVDDPNKNISKGSIITVKKNPVEYRGVLLKKPKVKKNNQSNTKTQEKPFRNSITIVMVLDKHINFKLSRNGTFQLTGCKSKAHVEKCVEYIWDFIKDFDDNGKKLYSFSSGNSLEMLIIPCMRNIDFSLGFIVDRNKMRKYMKTRNDYYCLLETESGYTGVSIKQTLDEDITKMRIKRRMLQSDETWKEEWTTYGEYLNTLKPKDRKNKLEKERHVTFLVFQSGTCIMSGIKKAYKRDCYYKFIDMIRDAFDHIEERLKVGNPTPVQQFTKPVKQQFVCTPSVECDSIVDEDESADPEEVAAITESITSKLRMAIVK